MAQKVNMEKKNLLLLLTGIFFFFWQLYHPFWISPIANLVAFRGGSQPWQGHASQPTMHAGYFSVSIIYQTLTWTTGSLLCTQMLTMHANRDVWTHARESALKVDFGRKIPCCTRESNLLYQLSYIPTPKDQVEEFVNKKFILFFTTDQTRVFLLTSYIPTPMAEYYFKYLFTLTGSIDMLLLSPSASFLMLCLPLALPPPPPPPHFPTCAQCLIISS